MNTQRSVSQAINDAILDRTLAWQKSDEAQRAVRSEIGGAIERAQLGDTTPDYSFDENDPSHANLLARALADVRAEHVRREREAAKILALGRKQRGDVR